MIAAANSWKILMPQNPLDLLPFAELRTNGVRLHVAQAGLDEGPLVIIVTGGGDFCNGGSYLLLKPVLF